MPDRPRPLREARQRGARPAGKVVHLVPQGQEPDYDRLGELAAAAAHPEVLAVLEAEETIKLALLAAARAGDCERVASIVEQWLIEPPVAVAAGLEGRRRR